MKITLKRIKQTKDCNHLYKKLLQHPGIKGILSPSLEFSTILKSIDFDDKIVCLQLLPKSYNTKIRLLAAKYAEYSLYLYETQYPKNNILKESLKNVRCFAHGKINLRKIRESCEKVEDLILTVEDPGAVAAMDAVAYAHYPNISRWISNVSVSALAAIASEYDNDKHEDAQKFQDELLMKFFAEDES